MNRFANIFQDRNGIREVIEELIGNEKDIYFQAYFYLCNRFGHPKVFDDYKKSMIWSFNVKNYIIQIKLNTSSVVFMIFGKVNKTSILSKNNFENYSSRSPYWVKYWRELNRNKDKYFDIFAKKRTKQQKVLLEKIYDDFLAIYNPNNEGWINYSEKDINKLFTLFVDNYNEKVIGLENFKHYDKNGYSNSKTRHALRTLRQFLNNMLTPISVRDVSFNIKGKMKHSEVHFYNRYVDNIKIEYKKK